MADDRGAAEKELVSLASRRWKLALLLTGIMLATYFGFLLLIAWNKAALGTVITPGLSWGILLGALVIVVAWTVTGVYVRWANRHYDGGLARFRADIAKASAADETEGK
jgi:uncharacterized membrane protein (DUF485 family)